MRTTRILAGALSAIIALSACGSASGKAATTTTTATSTAAATTTTVATTTTTAAPTTTAATTTVAPTTTTTAAIDQTAAIKQAILDYESVRQSCLRKPATCDPATYATGQRAQSEKAFIARLIGMNLVMMPSPDDPYYYVFGSVVLSPDLSMATVEYCFWDTDVLQTESGVVFNGDKVPQPDTMTLVVEDGKWRVSKIVNHDPKPGQETCGPRP
jgi:ABC-type amino acid transport substrate-binding protein